MKSIAKKMSGFVIVQLMTFAVAMLMWAWIETRWSAQATTAFGMGFLIAWIGLSYGALWHRIKL